MNKKYCVDFILLLRRGTLTGKIGNKHRSWFSSVTVKTIDVTMHWEKTNLIAEIVENHLILHKCY